MMLSRETRPGLQRSVALLAVAGMLLISACNKTRHESHGDVGSWLPQPGNTIQTVPVEQVRSAIQQRLSSGPPAHVTQDHWRHVKSLYAQFSGTPLWLKDNGTDTQRTPALIDALNESTNDALDFSGFPLAALRDALTALKQNKQPTAQQLADADVLLSAAYVTYAEVMFTGQLDPKQMSQDWHINPQEEHVDSAIVRSLRSDSLPAALTAMRPQNAGYEGLRKAIGQYRQIAAKGGWPAIPAGRALKIGQHDVAARLSALRARLAAEGYLSDSTSAAAGANGAAAQSGATYDRQLAAAVANYQAHHGIVVDSMLGTETVSSMNQPADFRVGQIAANLERYRWLPRFLGQRYIFVNVPAFRLEAYDSGQKALDMKVVVGAEYENRRTPVFSDVMQFVVFRPYWMVTDSIAAKEIWPKAQADPGYLERNNYEIYNDHGKQRVRQLPGAKNSLGLIKFMFPNDFNIYLHDTPQQELFQKDIRAFSHGCIRLEKPAELASWVLGWPIDRVEQQMHDGPDNHQVDLPRHIPVYIVYFTAYMRDGELYFGNDLYFRDQDIVSAVAKGAAPDAQTLQTLAALKQLVS